MSPEKIERTLKEQEESIERLSRPKSTTNCSTIPRTVYNFEMIKNLGLLGGTCYSKSLNETLVFDSRTLSRITTMNNTHDFGMGPGPGDYDISGTIDKEARGGICTGVQALPGESGGFPFKRAPSHTIPVSKRFT